MPREPSLRAHLNILVGSARSCVPEQRMSLPAGRDCIVAAWARRSPWRPCFLTHPVQARMHAARLKGPPLPAAFNILTPSPSSRPRYDVALTNASRSHL